MRPEFWIAAVCEPAGEYVARVDLERYGLHPYLPEFKRPILPRGVARPLVKAFPLFPRYIFLPLADMRQREFHYARGLKRPRPVLADGSGVPWKAPHADIEVLLELERAGQFDVALVPGDRVQLRQKGPLSGVEIFLARASKETAEILMPLFGGCRGRTALSELVKAS